MDGIHFSRRMTDSFGVVTVPDQPNVRVYADNQLVARTDAGGKAFLPRLRPYEPNRVSIEQADLPLSSEIESLQLDLTPYFRSGVAATFGVKAARGGIVTVLLANGAPLPAGAIVRIGDHEFPVGLRGEVYLTGLAASNHVEVVWEGQSCSFEVAYLPSSDPQPYLGTYSCTGVKP
jgi:outer membrane usher protein